jgi:hypothetical protein
MSSVVANVVMTAIDGDRNKLLEVKLSQYLRGFFNDRPQHGRGNQNACTTAAGR